MIIKDGNLFDTSASAVGHGVNVHGVMGAGIAKQFRAKFPMNYQQYKRACGNDTLAPGGCFVYQEGDVRIYNMASQTAPGPTASYRLLRYAAFAAAQDAARYHIDRIAIPQVGCGIGGLVWSQAKAELEIIEAITGVEFEVWIYDGS